MKSCGLTAVVLMVLIVKDVLSVCSKSGCKCGEACADDNNNWCNIDNDMDCSCKKGCLIFDKFVNPGEEQTIYCRDCRCPEKENEGIAQCSVRQWCKPDDLILYRNYPYEHGENPACLLDEIPDREEI